jgi:hypothetical protein
LVSIYYEASRKIPSLGSLGFGNKHLVGSSYPFNSLGTILLFGHEVTFYLDV